MAKVNLDALLKIVFFLVSGAVSTGTYFINDKLAQLDRADAENKEAITAAVAEFRGRVGLLENHEVGIVRDIGAQGNDISDLKHALEKLDDRERAREAPIGGK